jgi:hypothetical protein
MAVVRQCDKEPFTSTFPAVRFYQHFGNSFGPFTQGRRAAFFSSFLRPRPEVSRVIPIGEFANSPNELLRVMGVGARCAEANQHQQQKT